MQVKLHIFILLSSSLLFSSVFCDPNHHHDHHNDFPWQNLLSSLGITIENENTIISSTEMHFDPNVGSKEHYTSEAPSEVMKSETTEGYESQVTAQDGTRYVITSSGNNSGGLGLGYKIGIPVVSILFIICFWYCICKCCCACCRDDSTNVVVMQQSTIQPQQPAPVPQIILQQPIIQQAPPVYDSSQRWAQPPPQGPTQWAQPPPQEPSQWGQPPQGPQWVPHPMGQQQHYSPNSGYDNPGFNPATAPPPYNTGKY